LSATRRTWGRRARIPKFPNKKFANTWHEAPAFDRRTAMSVFADKTRRKQCQI
jgi:hypothetical protein